MEVTLAEPITFKELHNATCIAIQDYDDQNILVATCKHNTITLQSIQDSKSWTCDSPFFHLEWHDEFLIAVTLQGAIYIYKQNLLLFSHRLYKDSHLMACDLKRFTILLVFEDKTLLSVEKTALFQQETPPFELYSMPFTIQFIRLIATQTPLFHLDGSLPITCLATLLFVCSTSHQIVWFYATKENVSLLHAASKLLSSQFLSTPSVKERRPLQTIGTSWSDGDRKIMQLSESSGNYLVTTDSFNRILLFHSKTMMGPCRQWKGYRHARVLLHENMLFITAPQRKWVEIWSLPLGHKKLGVLKWTGEEKVIQGQKYCYWLNENENQLARIILKPQETFSLFSWPCDDLDSMLALLCTLSPIKQICALISVQDVTTFQQLLHRFTAQTRGLVHVESWYDDAQQVDWFLYLLYLVQIFGTENKDLMALMRSCLPLRVLQTPGCEKRRIVAEDLCPVYFTHWHIDNSSLLLYWITNHLKLAFQLPLSFQNWMQIYLTTDDWEIKKQICFSSKNSFNWPLAMEQIRKMTSHWKEAFTFLQEANQGNDICLLLKQCEALNPFVSMIPAGLCPDLLAERESTSAVVFAAKILLEFSSFSPLHEWLLDQQTEISVLYMQYKKWIETLPETPQRTLALDEMNHLRLLIGSIQESELFSSQVSYLLASSHSVLWWDHAMLIKNTQHRASLVVTVFHVFFRDRFNSFYQHLESVRGAMKSASLLGWTQETWLDHLRVWQQIFSWMKSISFHALDLEQTCIDWQYQTVASYDGLLGAMNEKVLKTLPRVIMNTETVYQMELVLLWMLAIQSSGLVNVRLSLLVSNPFMLPLFSLKSAPVSSSSSEEQERRVTVLLRLQTPLVKTLVNAYQLNDLFIYHSIQYHLQRGEDSKALQIFQANLQTCIEKVQKMMVHECQTRVGAVLRHHSQDSSIRQCMSHLRVEQVQKLLKQPDQVSYWERHCLMGVNETFQGVKQLLISVEPYVPKKSEIYTDLQDLLSIVKNGENL